MVIRHRSIMTESVADHVESILELLDEIHDAVQSAKYETEQALQKSHPQSEVKNRLCSILLNSLDFEGRTLALMDSVEEIRNLTTR